MPTIKLSDKLGLAVTITPDPNSAIAKYIKNPALALAPTADLVKALNAPLDQAAFRQFGTGLNFSDSIEAGSSGAELTIGAGAGISLTISAKKGDKVAPDRYRAPVTVGEHEAWLTLGVKATLAPGISSQVNNLSFGFEGGTEIGLYNHRCFETSPAAPLLSEALKTAIASFSIPADVEDLSALPAGAVAAVNGKGSLKVSGDVELSQSMGLFTSPSLPAGIGPVKVKAGGSVSVGASFEITGEYEIRVRKLDANTVELGYYTKNGEEFEIRASAQAVLSAKLGTRDLIPALLRVISSDPEADEEAFAQAGLSEKKISDISDTIQAGIDRSLAAAASFEFAALESDAAAFLYQIRLDQLTAEGRRTVHSALDGDLRPMHEDEESLPEHGIRLVRSILTNIRERKHTFKVNLIGVYNFISISDLMLKGEVLFDPDRGGLVISDQVTAKRIRASMLNFAADPDKLRQVTAEHFLLTAAYRASQIAGGPQLESSHSYFEYHRKTNRQTMKDNLDALEAAGLLAAGAKQEMLGPVDDFGASTFLLEATYTDELCTSLFLSEGAPRSRDEYDRIGRRALAGLIDPSDADGYRREPVSDDSLWRSMCAAGPAALRSVLPAHLRNDDVKPAVIAGDYVAIRWWSESMSRTGQALAHVRAFFARTGVLDEENNEFKGLRKQLAECLTDVAKNASKLFGDPWGLIAMDMAAGQKADLQAKLGCARLVLAEARTKAIGAGGGTVAFG